MKRSATTTRNFWHTRHSFRWRLLMALPIVEAARTRLAGRPLAGLLDDAVITLFELYPVEQKVLAAILLAEGNVLEATKLAGTSDAAFKQALDNLAARQLLTVKAGMV